MWKSLLIGRDLLKTYGRWNIGADTKLSFTKDVWLPNGEKVLLSPGATCYQLKKLANQDLMWKTQALRVNLQPNQAIHALQTRISWFNPNDTLYWPHTADGHYSVKSGYKTLQKATNSLNSKPTTSNTTPKEVWDTIWGAQVPQKIKHFTWKACHNALPTKENLTKRRLSRDNLCPKCQKQPETAEHMLLLCDWTRPIWFGMGLYPTPNAYNVTNLPNWLVQINNTGRNDATDTNINVAMFMQVIWSIWKARNDMVFSSKQPNPTGIVILAKSTTFEYMQADTNTHNSGNHTSAQHRHTRWQPPMEAWTHLTLMPLSQQQQGKEAML